MGAPRTASAGQVSPFLRVIVIIMLSPNYFDQERVHESETDYSDLLKVHEKLAGRMCE